MFHAGEEGDLLAASPIRSRMTSLSIVTFVSSPPLSPLLSPPPPRNNGEVTCSSTNTRTHTTCDT